MSEQPATPQFTKNTANTTTEDPTPKKKGLFSKKADTTTEGVTKPKKKLGLFTNSSEVEIDPETGIPLEKGPMFVWGGGKKSKPEVVARSIRSLVMILRVGETEARALEIVGEQFGKYTIGRLYTSAADRMRTYGASFKQALLHENDVFPRTVKELIMAAPTAQAMQANLQKAATLVLNSQDVKKKMLQALIQPGIMLAMSIAFLFIATAFIIPSFNGIFSQIGAEEPQLNVIVRTASEYVKWVLVVIIAIIILIAIYWFAYGKRSEKVRLKVDTVILKLPFIGPIMQLASTSKLLDLLSLNLAIGMVEPAALESASGGCGNDAIASHCKIHAEKMRVEGVRLKDFVNSELFPLTARYMIQSAPSIQQEIEIMDELSPEFRMEADLQLEGFTKAIEPILTYVVYGVAAVTILAVATPLFGIYPALMEFGDQAMGETPTVPIG